MGDNIILHGWYTRPLDTTFEMGGWPPDTTHTTRILARTIRKLLISLMRWAQTQNYK